MKPTLLIMAAGMGSRYGGLKQLDGLGPSGEVIIDYSVYDAIQAGFGKVVFIIRKEFDEAFREKVGGKFEKTIDTRYVYQELDECLGGYKVPDGREKPWGTGHAVICAKQAIQEPFAVINADDFYGRPAFRTIHEFLTSGSDEQAMVGYVLRNTLSEYGDVSRGVTEVDDDGYLCKVIEMKKIVKKGEGGVYIDPQGGEHPLTGDEIASMNFWGFQPGIFDLLEDEFYNRFLPREGNELKSEFYIPISVDKFIKQGKTKCRVLESDSPWFGITYAEDRPVVVNKFRELVNQGVYPDKLF